MPMISESGVELTHVTSPPLWVTSSRYSSLGGKPDYHEELVSPGTTVGDCQVSRGQLGFRSGSPDYKSWEESLRFPSGSAKWKDTARVVLAHDILERSTGTSPNVYRNGVRLTTNPRDYSESSNGVEIVEGSWSMNNNSSAFPPWITSRGNVVFPVTDRVIPTPVAEDYWNSGKAAQILRSMRPTKPHAGLAQFLGELAELPFSVLTGIADISKGVVKGRAGTYVGYNFGVVPFVSDIQKMAQAVLHSEKIVNDFARQAGLLSSRKRSWDELTNVVTDVPPSTTGRLMNFGSSVFSPNSRRIFVGGTITRRTTVRHSVWGSFEYFMGDPASFVGRMDSYQKKAQNLLGMNLDSSTIWELTPWSWLIDWHTDIGGLLAYQESVSNDSLVLRGAGYQVRVDVEDLYYYSVSGGATGDYVTTASGSHAWSRYKTSIKRRPLSPYGLESSASQTAKQWAILGALGITRAPGKF